MSLCERGGTIPRTTGMSTLLARQEKELAIEISGLKGQIKYHDRQLRYLAEEIADV